MTASPPNAVLDEERPPRRGFWRAARAGRWLRVGLPVVSVLGFALDIALLAAAGAGRPAEQIAGAVAVAVLYTAGLALLPTSSSVGSVLVLASAVGALAVQVVDVPAVVLAFAVGFSAALGAPAFQVFLLASAVAWCAALIAMWPASSGLALVVGSLLATAAVVGWAARRTLVRQAGERARIAELRAETARALRAQRILVSRELHDLVAHHLTVIAMLSALPERERTGPSGQRHWDVVGAASREGLTELRRLLDVLADAPTAPESPVGSLESSVFDLTVRLEALGVPVTVHAPALPHVTSARDRAVLERVLLEATTNAIRHGAPPLWCRVRLEREDGEVVLSVSNPTDAEGGKAGEGIGLRSMAARLAEAGGALEAGADGLVWTLRARLPLRGALHDSRRLRG